MNRIRCERCGRFVGRKDLRLGRAGLLLDGNALCPAHVHRHPILTEQNRRMAGSFTAGSGYPQSVTFIGWAA